jgi:nitrite reductase/ring-hydroxylating ferredoxin subunit
MTEAGAPQAPASGFVCLLDELAPGTMTRVDIGAVPIVVCRSEATGEVFAMDARCPHQGALLCFGVLTGMKVMAGGTSTLVRRGEILRCPLHHWDFDVRTGVPINAKPSYRATTYPVRVEDGRIYVGAG